MSKRRILVTGLSGAVGKAIRPALETRYEVAALSRSGVRGLSDHLNFRGTVADLKSIQSAFRDVNTVVHLAADGGVLSPHWESSVRRFQEMIAEAVRPELSDKR